MMQLETILIIDTDADARALLQESISEAGFDVMHADSGQQGLALYTEHRPALVLIDFHMPDMDGFTFCQKLRAMPADNDVPLVIMVSEEHIDEIKIAFDSGATDFIIRPLRSQLLTLRLRYILRASTAMRSARANERLLAQAQRIAHIGNWTWDLDNEELHVSAEICRMLAIPQASPCVLHQLFIKAIHDDDKTLLNMAIERSASGKPADVELRIRHPDGKQRVLMMHAESNPQAGARHLLGAMQDITERKKNDEAIRKLAFFDQVTGLPNRTLFQEHLQMAIYHAKRNHSKIAVLFLDLDNFKRINDSLGHVAGDQLLTEVSKRLQQSIRTADLAAAKVNGESDHALARLGGDEFTIMLVDIMDTKHVHTVTDRIMDNLNAPFMLAGNRVMVTSSIGIAIYPKDGDDIDTLLKHADTAMYQVKSTGRNGFFFYDDKLRQQSRNRIELEAELYHALEHDEMTLFYQPKVNARNCVTVGFEALIRWIHPERGMVSPMDFIPIAEDSGLIIPMGKWVIRTACRQHQIWRQAGKPSVSISVNLSAHQFTDVHLLAAIRNILTETDMPPEFLEFEITETVLMDDADKALSILNEMKSMGLKLSIDDFGTGYSSISYLKNFPADVLKIDRAFIKDLPDDKQDATITSAIINLGKTLNLCLIAEGVETRRQLDWLKRRGCDQIQGYFFSPPVPAEKAVTMLDHPFRLETD